MDSSIELVSFLARSENRVEALLSLSAGPRTRPELQEETSIPRATLSRILADFRDRELVSRDDHRYALTPLGELLSAEIGSLVEAIEGMQRLDDVRRWLDIGEFDFPIERLADADVIIPSTQDPTAPIRRAEELLAEAAQVRLVANSMIPSCLEAVWRAVTAGRQTLVWVGTPEALAVVAADPQLTRWTRELLESDHVSSYLHDEGFPQALFVVDETVFTPVTDEAGTVQGHIETDDEVVRTWADETIARYVHEAEPMAVELLTP